MSIVMIIIGVALVGLATFVDKRPTDRNGLTGAFNIMIYITGVGIAFTGIFHEMGI